MNEIRGPSYDARRQPSNTEETDMPRRVLLSMLGTSQYQAVEYLAADGSGAGDPQKFVQIACIKALLARPEPITHAYFFLTEQARQKNWENGGQKIHGTDDPKPDPQYDGEREWIGLEESLRRETFHGEPLAELIEIHDVRIPDGKTPEEMWEVFRKVADVVEEGDVIHVDVTHGFRTQPLILLWTLDFVRRVKDAHIEEVSYGAFEARGLPGLTDAQRPTWDLKPFLTLRDWIDAYQNLNRRGDVGLLARIIRDTEERLRREFVDRARAAARGTSKRKRDELVSKAASRTRPLKTFGDRVLALARALELVHLHRIPPVVQEVLDAIEGVREWLDREDAREVMGHGVAPTKILLDKIARVFEPMAGPEEPSMDRILAQVAAAEFLCRHDRFMQGLTVLRETMVDLLGSMLQDDSYDRKELDAAVGALLYASRDLTPNVTGEVERIYNALGADPRTKKIITSLNSIAEERNKLDHGHTKKNDKPSTLASLGSKAREWVEVVRSLAVESMTSTL